MLSSHAISTILNVGSGQYRWCWHTQMMRFVVANDPVCANRKWACWKSCDRMVHLSNCTSTRSWAIMQLHYHSDSLRTFSNHYYCSVCFCVLFMLNNKNRRFQANFGNNCRWQGWRRQGSDSLEKMFLLNLICGGIHQDHQFNASAQQDVECTWLEPFWPAKLFYIIYNEGGSKTAAERIWNDKKNVNKRNHGPMNKTKGFEKPNTCSKTSYVV